MNTSERAMRARIASYHSWAKTKDRPARTAAARKASHETRFLNQARELHPDASDEQIAQAADALKKAYYSDLAKRSAISRRIRSEEAKAEKQKRIEQELAQTQTDTAA
jgi:hypothetical protein